MRILALALACVLSLPAHAKTYDAPEDAYPGQHTLDAPYLNDASTIMDALAHVPWTKRCKLRASQYHTGFLIKGKLLEAGQPEVMDVKVFIAGGVVAADEEGLEECLGVQVITMRFPDAFRAGTKVGYEDQTEFMYYYTLP